MGNFKFLKKDYPELYQLCSDVAKYIDSDKSISMLKARQAIEFMVKYLGSETNDLFVNINNLEDKNIANSRIIDLFHLIRKKANKSVHNDSNADTEGVLDAVTEICVWLVVGHDKKNISIIHFNDKEKFFLRKNGYCDEKSAEERFDASDTINPLEAVGRFTDENPEQIDVLEQDVFETYEEYCERIESMPPIKIGYAFLEPSQFDDFCEISFPLFHVSKHSTIESVSVAAFYASGINKEKNIDGILKAKLKVYEDKIYYDYNSVTLQDDNNEVILSPVSWERFDYETEEQYAGRISNLPLLPVAIAKPIRKEYDLQKQSLPFETISLSYASKIFTDKRILCLVDRDNAKKICLMKSPFKVYAHIEDVKTIGELLILNQEQDVVLSFKDNQTSIKDLAVLKFGLYSELAQQGNANAQYKLAQCYKDGYGTDVDEQKAFEWYRRAAEQGYSAAQYEVARHYINGIDEDEHKAFKWYKRAAEQGHVESQYELAYCYENGYGIDEDEHEAFKWYKRAAEQGHVDSQYDLACCYENGDGIDKDEHKAFKWYKRAAEQGHVESQVALANFYKNGYGIDKDERKAVKWYKRAAEQGDELAQYYLTELYINGVDEDEEKAFEWYKYAAENGNEEAQYMLAQCYEHGNGVAEDEQKAIEWYRKALENGKIAARYKLAQLGWN